MTSHVQRSAAVGSRSFGAVQPKVCLIIQMSSPLQGLDVLVDASSYLLVRQHGEPPLDLVEPGGAGGGEVHVEAGMRGRHRWIAGVLCVEAFSQMVHIQVGGYLLVDEYEEFVELNGTVSAVDLADHLAGGGVQRGKQRRDPAAHVVVSAALRHARHHGQHRSRPVQHLGESAAGVSPAAALRTVRKPLGLHGSHRPVAHGYGLTSFQWAKSPGNRLA